MELKKAGNAHPQARPPGEGRITLQELRTVHPAVRIGDDVRAGLSARPKRLPPKYFYDARGSLLFERICQTPEYYPSRTEEALLSRLAGPIIEEVRPRSIVELGSGSSRKTRHFFSACERLASYPRYLPIDVCGEMLLDAGRSLLERYAWLRIEAFIGDYSLGLAHFPLTPGPRLFLFLGGTLGNFEEDEAVSFLRDLRAIMRENDALLLGADRVKDRAVLDAAYNDAEGLTAAFNLNVLNVVNHALDARFDPARFAHEAWYDPARSQIEMHLRARTGQRVPIQALGVTVGFEAGESIRTEISRKFTPESLARLLAEAGFVLRRHYQADNAYYSLVLAEPAL